MKNLLDRYGILTILLVALWFAAIVVGPQAQARTRVDKLQSCCIVNDVKAGMLSGKGEIKNNARNFKIKYKSTKEYNLGQTVYISRQGDYAAVTGFPIKVTKRDKMGASSRKMETTIILSNTGRIDGTTKIWTAEALRGFTGGVLVGITDLSGNVLHYTKMRKYGVDGTANPNSNSRREEKWSEEVPKKVLDKAGAVVIWHSRQPKNRFPGAVDWVVKNWDCIVDVYKLVEHMTDDETPGGGDIIYEGPVLPPQEPPEAVDFLSHCRNIFG